MSDVLSTYRAILSYPGAAAFAFSGLLARLPSSMFNISIILLVQMEYGSYEMAGRVAAVGVLVWALQTVPTARYVDRVGQRAGMIPLTALYLIGAATSVWVVMSRGPEWLLWICIAVASCSGPLGSLTRARWSTLLRSDREIHTAFALEGSLDEILFICGPALATVLATTVHPAAGVIVCSVATVIGLSILLSLRSTEPPTRGDSGGVGLGWRIPMPVVAAAIISLGLGLLFGASDLSAIAFADEHGYKHISGALIGVFATGSMVGGLVYGAIHWKAPLWKRTIIGAGLLAAGFALLTTASSMITFGLFAFIAGAFIAPSITNADSVVQRVVKRDQITEGMAWVRIGMGIGVAIGGWIAGWLIDWSGAMTGVLAAAGAAVLTFGFTLLMIPLLKRASARTDYEASPAAPVPLETDGQAS